MAFIEPMHRNKPNITYLFTYPTQLVCRELRPEGLVAWCPGMLRYGWQVHNIAH